MKKKKRNFIIKIFSLLLLSIISVTLLGSWTYDPQNDLVISSNIWDEQWEVGGINADTGDFITDNNSIRSKNYVEIKPSTTYYCKAPNNYSTGRVAYYDSSKTYLGQSNSGWGILPNNNTFTTPSNAKYMRFKFQSTSYNHDIMINVSDIRINGTYEPYGTYVNQQKLDDLELKYDDLTEQYSNLYDEKEQLQQQYDSLLNNYNTLNTNYEQLEQNYQDMTNLKEYYENKYNETYNDYQAIQQQYEDLLINYNNLQTQYNLISQNMNQTNTYKYFYNAEVYYFNDVTHTYNYYVNNIVNANASGTIQNITQNSNRVRYMDLPTSIQNYITTQADTPNGTHGYILIKLNVPTKLGINVEYQYLASNFKTALYNNYWDSEFVYDFGNNPTSTIASLIIDNNNLTLQEEYQYLFIENIANRGGDIAFSNIYADEYLQAYANGYNTALQDIDTITYNYKEQIKDLNIRIVHLNQEINTLQEQVNRPLDLNMRNLIWYIAETPFTSFKTIWNVDFLGLNIASFVTGLFSIWIVIFIIRKIFK